MKLDLSISFKLRHEDVSILSKGDGIMADQCGSEGIWFVGQLNCRPAM